MRDCPKEVVDPLAAILRDAPSNILPAPALEHARKYLVAVAIQTELRRLELGEEPAKGRGKLPPPMLARHGHILRCAAHDCEVDDSCT